MTLGTGRVLDLKFLYDDSLLILWSLKGMLAPFSHPSETYPVHADYFF